jgi:hypothetical protein
MIGRCPSAGVCAAALFALIGAAIGGPGARAADVAGGTDAWPDYPIIMWQPQTDARLAGLARLGVTAGMIHGRGNLDPGEIGRQTAPFRALDMHWYVENIATDFYSAYHRWYPDRPVTWLFDQAKRRHQQDPADMAAFVRTPSLSDPVWLGRIAARLDQHVRAFGRPRPLFYNLADEAGTGDLAAAWDFDLAPPSLAGMRVWLRSRYGSLTALNREWGSNFPTWSAVGPMTTDAALAQADENFAAWSDFKDWMNVAFARAVRAGTDAVHAADPQARTAIEGAQIPGWGGYDYTRLASTVDVMEMYDYGNNVEIARSLNPNLIILETSSVDGPEAVHAVWHELLLGIRGLILWDENGAFVDDAGAPTERGHTLGALATGIRSGLGAQLAASSPAADPVAILYSPASMRVQWLRDRKADGKPWAERQAETEYDEDNPVRAAMRRSSGLLAHLGVAPRWLTPAALAGGDLVRRQVRLLILPHAIALSTAEAQAVRAFQAQGGTVVADGPSGLFDEHGRRRAAPALPDPAGAGHDLLQGMDDGQGLDRMRQLLVAASAAPRIALRSPDGKIATGVEARLFRDGDATVVGLQRDWSKDTAAQDRPVVLDLGRPAYVYDLRHPAPPQHVARVTLTLGGVEPALLAVLPAPPPPLVLSGPQEARAGSELVFTVGGRQAGATRLDARVVHVELTAPDGTVAPGEAANLVLRGASAAWRVRLPQDAPAGDWRVRLADPLGGRTIEARLRVLAGAAAVSPSVVTKAVDGDVK